MRGSMSMTQCVAHRYERGRAELSGHPLRTKGEKCRGYFPGLGCRLIPMPCSSACSERPQAPLRNTKGKRRTQRPPQARRPFFRAQTGPLAGKLSHRHCAVHSQACVGILRTNLVLPLQGPACSRSHSRWATTPFLSCSLTIIFPNTALQRPAQRLNLCYLGNKTAVKKHVNPIAIVIEFRLGLARTGGF